jgi:putative spermidine/putrescine transport system permease protein
MSAGGSRDGRGRDAALRTALCLGVGFILLPLLIVVLYSFSSVAYGVFPPPGLSLRWYGHLLQQPAFGRAFVRSLLVGLASTSVALVVGLLAALALVRGRFPGRDALQAFLLSPIVMPKIVLGVGWFIFFARLANLVGLDPALEEAAQDLGASRATVLLRIVVPQIRSGLTVSALLAFLVSFDQVESSLFLTRGENNTLPIEMFLYMEKWQDPTVAALSSLLILFAFTLVVGGLLLARGVDLRRILPR